LKYDPLRWHLAKLAGPRWRPSFAQIESILGFPLPQSARRYPAWWGNDPKGHSHSLTWLETGWKTEEVDLGSERVTFVRDATFKVQKSKKAVGSSGAVGGQTAAPSADIPWEWDKACTLQGYVELTWTPVGRLTLDVKGSLRFPKVGKIPGLYRFQVRNVKKRAAYVGESDNLQRRFSNYRHSHPSQLTNHRLNGILKSALIAGCEIGVDIAKDSNIKNASGQPLAVEYSNKAHRRLLENLALIVGGGVAVESLNL